MDHRHVQPLGRTHFFTVNLAARDSDPRLRDIETRRTAMTTLRKAHRLRLLAVVVLPAYTTAGSVEERGVVRGQGKVGDVSLRRLSPTYARFMSIRPSTAVSGNRPPGCARRCMRPFNGGSSALTGGSVNEGASGGARQGWVVLGFAGSAQPTPGG